jgi:hypothetical protein
MTPFSLQSNGGVYFSTKWRLAVSSCEIVYRGSSSTAVLWTLSSVWGLKVTTTATTGGGGRKEEEEEEEEEEEKEEQEQEQLYTNLIEFSYHCR